MPEDVAKHFLFPNFTTPVPGTMREVIGNDTNARGNSSGAIVESFIKRISSKIFVHPAYLIDGPGP